MRNVRVAVVAFAVLAVGCASEEKKSCKPPGVWAVTYRPTSNSGGVCAGVTMFETSWQIAKSSSTLEVSQDGENFVGGTFDEGDCHVYNTTAVYAGSDTDTGGNPYSWSDAIEIDVVFDGKKLRGAAAENYSTSPSYPGETPCSVQYEIEGEKE